MSVVGTATQSSPQRDVAHDILRGWAILAVVLIHSSGIFFSLSDHVDRYFRWAVPVFIVQSAYFTVLSLLRKQEKYSAYLKRRMGRLFVPYVVYSLVYFFSTANWSTLSASSLITRHVIGYGWSGQYFFIILFQLVPLYPLFSRRVVSAVSVGVVFGIALFSFPFAPLIMSKSGLIGKLSDHPFIYWLPYAFLGAYLAHHDTAWRTQSKRIPAGLAQLAIFALPPIILWKHNSTYGQSGYVLPQILIASYCIMLLSAAAFYNGRPRVLAYIGQNSLGIFCLNPLFLLLLQRSHLLPGPYTELPVLIRTIDLVILTLIVILLCLLSSEGLKRIGLKSLVA